MPQKIGSTVKTTQNKYSGQDIPGKQVTYPGSITLSLDDIGKVVRMDSASAQTITIPPDSSVPFEDGSEVAVVQSGAGTLTFVAGSGVIINCAGSLVMNGQHATAALFKVAGVANTWLLSGRLV